MVTTITISVFSAPLGSAVNPMSSTNHSTSRPAKLSAVKAAFRKPASVMTIWMVDRKLSGACTSFSSRAAILSPSSAWRESFPSLREMTAISAAAKKALTKMSRISMMILGNNGSSIRTAPP